MALVFVLSIVHLWLCEACLEDAGDSRAQTDPDLSYTIMHGDRERQKKKKQQEQAHHSCQKGHKTQYGACQALLPDLPSFFYNPVLATALRGPRQGT